MAATKEAASVVGGLDLGALDAANQLEEDGLDVHLKGPDGAPLYFQVGEEKKPVTWRVYGSYSKHFKKLEEDRRTRREGMTRREIIEDQAGDLLEVAVRMSCGFSGIVQDGAPVDPGPATYRTILPRYPGIRSQVVDGIYDHAAFFRAASRD